jgi:hypothetical protein
MSTVEISGPWTEAFTVKGHDNPYDEGPLISADSAQRIATAWCDEQNDADEARTFEHVEGAAIVLASAADAEISLDTWIAATEFHDFERNASDHHGGGEEAYCLVNWPLGDDWKWKVIG